MWVLKFVFKFSAMLGMWLPVEFSNSFKKKILYVIYQFTCSLIYLSMLSFTMYFLFKQLTSKNSEFDNYYEDLFLSPVQLMSYLKFIFVIVKRNKIIKLADYFLQDEFKPLNKFEENQEKKYELIIK